MQSVSSRIWTRIAVFISYGDNDYTTGTKKPEGRFTNLHIDIVGPLPIANDCQYILTIIDRFTRWSVAVPLRDISAETIYKTILREWIAVFSCPSVITTDRGSQFQSTLFDEFTKLLGVKHKNNSISPLRKWINWKIP